MRLLKLKTYVDITAHVLDDQPKGSWAQKVYIEEIIVRGRRAVGLRLRTMEWIVDRTKQSEHPF